MKTFTQYPARLNLALILKIIITALWLLCIASAAWSAPDAGYNELPPPAINQNPTDKTVCSGSGTTFTIGGATGTGTISYQWEVSANGTSPYTAVSNDATYSGATTATLTINNITIGLNNKWYRCVATDALNSSTASAGAKLTVNPSPVVTAASGHVTRLCENAQGAMIIPGGEQPGFGYQWQVSKNNGTSWADVDPAEGYTGYNTLSITYPIADLAKNNYIYRYKVTDLSTACSSTSVTVDTVRVFTKPVPIGNPSGLTICPGDNAKFGGKFTWAAGIDIAYQWKLRPTASSTWTDITDDAVYNGTQTDTLTLTSFTPFQGNSYIVRLEATYPASTGCPNSTAQALLTVRSLPSVALQPTDVAVCANSNAQFKVTGAGSATLSYQWQTDNGTAGSTWSNVVNPSTVASTLLLNAVTTAMNGYKYRVIISNACAPPATSSARTLTVRRSGTWLGAKDTLWEEPQNWCGGIPDNTIDVLVPNWPTNMPVISDATTATAPAAYFKSLEIENAARLTIRGGVVDNMNGPFNIQGTVLYVATRDQNIFHANHGSLVIDGSGNKVLGSNVDIAHNLGLGGTAKLVTGNNILTMKNGSSPIATSAFTDPATSWIVTGNGNSGAANTGLGGLRIEQVDAIRGATLFPVGPTPAAYNPTQLTNAGAVDNFTVAVNDQVIPGGMYAAGINRTWKVSEATPGGSNVMLNLKWQGSEEQSSFDRTQTEIIRSNGTYIVEQSVKAPASGINPYARADGSFATLTLFSVASNSVPLPIQLQSFLVQKTGNASTGLTWKTDAQFTVKYFDVQRSADGRHFVTIGQVSGATGKTTYNYTDNMPGSGTIFYRLQITGEQNEVVYSPIQSVALASVNGAQLRPSATNASFTSVFVSLPQESVVAVYVTDITGRIHVRQSLQLNKGDHQLPLWIGSLSKGVYYVHVKDGKGIASVLTLVKQ